MKRFLCLLLVAGLNFTICTGGVFSATMVLASAFVPTESTVAYMSSAKNEVFLCRSFSEAQFSSTDAVEDIEVQVPQKSATTCGSQDTCLSSVTAQRPDRLAVKYAIPIVKQPEPSSTTAQQIAHQVEPNQVIMSSFFNRTMIKIE